MPNKKSKKSKYDPSIANILVECQNKDCGEKAKMARLGPKLRFLNGYLHITRVHFAEIKKLKLFRQTRAQIQKI